MATKVLILSYFFPPCNLPGAQRIHSWARHLHESGIYPIVITRSWTLPITTGYELFLSDEQKMRHEQHGTYEVYYMPYRGNWRDALLKRFGPNRMIMLRRALTFWEHLSQNFTLWFLPYRNIYEQADRLLQQDRSIKLILASGMPFALFGMCHRLSQKHRIPWIADYRDDWNTTSWKSNLNEQSFLRGSLSLAEQFLQYFERQSEKRWLSSATLFTTVSRYYVWKISNFILKPGKVIYNGYDDTEPLPPKQHQEGTLVITYAGNLYFSQDISIFADALHRVLQLRPHAKITLQFLGTGYDPKQAERIRTLFAHMPVELLITSWLRTDELRNYIKNTDIFLTFANTGIKGVIPTKSFAYLTANRPILLCPGDHDELDEVIIRSGLGVRANTADRAAHVLLHLLDVPPENRTDFRADAEFIRKFYRKEQAAELGSIIHHILEK